MTLNSPPPRVNAGRKGYSTLVVIRTEPTWHLSKYAALRAVFREIQSLLEMDKTVAMTSSMAKALSSVDSGAKRSWQEFIESTQRTPYELEALASNGEPSIVELDPEEQVAVVMWKDDAEPPASEEWGGHLLEVTHAPDGTGRSFHLSTPFREIYIKSLPKDTKFVRITDMRHAITAALREVLDTILRDIGSFRDGLNVEQIWQRMRYQSAFLHAGVRVATRSLPEDEFRTWREQLPVDISLVEAPTRISEIASTMRAQRILALHVIATIYGNAISECEKQRSAQERDWVKKTIAMLSSAKETLDTAMEGYTAALLAFAKLARDRKHELLTILSPVPRTLPLLALVPLADNPVKPLSRRRKPAAGN